jgi:hypothetical protein
MRAQLVYIIVFAKGKPYCYFDLTCTYCSDDDLVIMLGPLPGAPATRGEYNLLFREASIVFRLVSKRILVM